MEALNYLKFDLRIIKKSIKYYVLIPVIFIIFMFFNKSYYSGISYLFFIFTIFETIPFSTQGNEKSTIMYYMFPTKISNMVLGRFLFLIGSELIVFTINGLIMMYLYNITEFKDLEVLITILSGVISLIISFIQYPIYYKFGLEKGRILSTMIYILPACAILMVPDILRESDLIVRINLIPSNNTILMFINVLVLSIIGYISYLISCRICKRKEV